MQGIVLNLNSACSIADGHLVINGQAKLEIPVIQSSYLAIGNGGTTISCDNDVEGRSDTEVPYMFIVDHQGNRSNYAGFIRGNLTEVETSALRTGTFSNKVGVFWNTSSEDSHITQGTISEIGIKYLPLDWAIS